MSYKIVEIFTSIKGEGLWIGKPMTFIRFSGCNLQCYGCDTPHSVGFEMTFRAILDRVKADKSVEHVVITGGEPLLQIGDGAWLLDEIRASGRRVHLETNGTVMRDPSMFDWIACSPKYGTETPMLPFADEVKICVNINTNLEFWATDGVPKWTTTKEQILYIQPWAKKQFVDPDSVLIALELVHRYPQWRYSCQLHKAIGVK